MLLGREQAKKQLRVGSSQQASEKMNTAAHLGS